VDDVVAVGEFEASADGLRDLDGPVECQPVLRSPFHEPLHVAAGHQLGDDVGLPARVPEVEHRDDVGMGPEAPHSLGLAPDALPTDFVETLGLDERKGDVAVEQRVVGEIDLLLAALAEEALDLIAAIRERHGVSGPGIRGGR
jgi:hypothetical protein